MALRFRAFLLAWEVLCRTVFSFARLDIPVKIDHIKAKEAVETDAANFAPRRFLLQDLAGEPKIFGCFVQAEHALFGRELLLYALNDSLSHALEELVALDHALPASTVSSSSGIMPLGRKTIPQA